LLARLGDQVIRQRIEQIGLDKPRDESQNISPQYQGLGRIVVHTPFPARSTFQDVRYRILLLQEISLSDILEEAAFFFPTAYCLEILGAAFLRTGKTELNDDDASQMSRAGSQNHVYVKAPR
jgi:hypothetical protein